MILDITGKQIHDISVPVIAMCNLIYKTEPDCTYTIIKNRFGPCFKNIPAHQMVEWMQKAINFTQQDMVTGNHVDPTSLYVCSECKDLREVRKFQHSDGHDTSFTFVPCPKCIGEITNG